MGWFKAAAKYKAIAAILIKYTIEEYEDYSYKEIAQLIVDRKTHEYNSIDELLQSEIDLEPSESGDKNGKNIRHDIVFKVRSLQNRKRLLNKVTINFEIQSAPKDYNMTSRAVYYTAHLLKNTIYKGNDYTDIHKV